ncbi:hypothetical protein CEXT_274491 [Caerostris extrusa]|uniref:Maturase K n=1 Tax=Caerostris extrusa TaxID=172846 RepID=A0AAV4WCC8_CAEEX|nr:hypothetical protein CEXT_274491 [Caerostris extrusa]
MTSIWSHHPKSLLKPIEELSCPQIYNTFSGIETFVSSYAVGLQISCSNQKLKSHIQSKLELSIILSHLSDFDDSSLHYQRVLSQELDLLLQVFGIPLLKLPTTNKKLTNICNRVLRKRLCAMYTTTPVKMNTSLKTPPAKQYLSSKRILNSNRCLPDEDSFMKPRKHLIRRAHTAHTHDDAIPKSH